MRGEDLRVSPEGRDDLAVEPAALVLQRGGQVPVVERGQRLDAVREQLVHQLVIEAQPRLVDRAVPVGDDARPADGEAVGADAVLLHQRDILAEAVVAVAGHVAGVAVPDVLRAGIVAEFVPDAQALAVLVPGALALVGGAGHAPEKIFGKLFHSFLLFLPAEGMPLRRERHSFCFVSPFAQRSPEPGQKALEKSLSGVEISR